jgi:hypothetical protein
MHTKNNIFNWFAAEALWYYVQRMGFDIAGRYEDIEGYNGKNGFTTFRDWYRLRELYGLKGDW